MLERSERRAWRVAVAGLVLGLIGIAAVFVQGPLRRVVEIPIVVDRVTGETTVQQRLSEETIPAMEALDKHNLAAFVRARESYSWMFLQRDFDQVARMAVPGVFAEYNRQFEGDGALQKKIGAAEEWRINIVGVRLRASGRSGNLSDATVTYDKVVRLTDRNLPDVTTRTWPASFTSTSPRCSPKKLTGWRTRSASWSRPTGPTRRSTPRLREQGHEAHRFNAPDRLRRDFEPVRADTCETN
ncbi:Type IV secretion system protein virB8 [Hydrogenophaga sp. T4]|nr:Type IV secretion system protein virB8 [Hydrogenophaga sp. T4]